MVTEDYDFNARRFKSEWGKLTTPDNGIPSIYSPQTINRYTYAFNNPYLYVDPTGKEGIVFGGGGEVGLGLGGSVEGGFYVTKADNGKVQYGTIFSGGGGLYLGGEGGARGGATFYPFAQTAKDLEGPAISASMSGYGGIGGDISAEYWFSKSSFGLGYGAGTGVGVEAFSLFFTISELASVHTATGVGNINLLNINLQTASRASNYFAHIQSHVQDPSRKSALAGSIINSIFSGNDVKWYYNEKTGNYQSWTGSGRPSNPDQQPISGSGESGGGGTSSGSSGSSGSKYKIVNINGKYYRCKNC